MLTIIYPSDPSTNFLSKIIDDITIKVDKEILNLILIEPTQKSHTDSLELIKLLPDNSTILFMGHGQSTCLYGAEHTSFTKRPFIDSNNINVFSNKYLFSLSCNSNEFLKRTYKQSLMLGAIGFGNLPTDMSEISGNRKYENLKVNEKVIQLYQQSIVELVTLSFIDLLLNKYSFAQLSNFFALRLNKMISEVILNNKNNNDYCILSNLLFMMKSEMIYIG